MVVLQDRNRVGGTERQSIWLVESLKLHAWDSRLRLLYPEDFPASKPWTRTFDGGSLAAMRAIGSVVSEFRTDAPDVLICMGRTANSMGFLLKCLFPGLKLVTTCRTNRRLPFFYLRSLGMSDLCITNSSWAADEVVSKTKLSSEEVLHIENALLRPELLQLDLSPESKIKAKEQLGFNPETPILCNVSSFVPGKNKLGLLTAFARCDACNSAELLLIGDGSERLECELYAKQLGIFDRVHFWGQVEAIEPALLASDLYVSTSLRDSLPNATIEAQAAGLPVVAFDIAGACETFEDGRSGIAVSSGNLEAFALAIERLLCSPIERQAYSAHGRLRASIDYAPEQIAARYNTALKTLF